MTVLQSRSNPAVLQSSSVGDLDRLPANYFKLTHGQLKVFIEILDSGSHYLQKIQGYVKVLQSYSTLCTEK